MGFKTFLTNGYCLSLTDKLDDMGFFCWIEDYFQRPPNNTIKFDEVEKLLRWQQLQEDKGTFTYNEEGFTYQAEDRMETVKWPDIERVVAFKLDRLTHDLICLRLYWEGGNLLICEDEPGWYQFASRLSTALSASRKWEERVTLPPFQTNETIVYQR